MRYDQVNDRDWAFVSLGVNRGLDRYARFLRKRVNQLFEQEQGDLVESYRKECAAERRHYQRVLREFNEWRAACAAKVRR